MICITAQPPETCSLPSVASSTSEYFTPAGTTSTLRQRKLSTSSNSLEIREIGRP